MRNVTDMSDMFWNAAAFNGDLSGWDVRNVTDMRYMFRGAAAFNGDLSGWDVSATSRTWTACLRAPSPSTAT